MSFWRIRFFGSRFCTLDSMVPDLFRPTVFSNRVFCAVSFAELLSCCFVRECSVSRFSCISFAGLLHFAVSFLHIILSSAISSIHAGGFPCPWFLGGILSSVIRLIRLIIGSTVAFSFSFPLGYSGTMEDGSDVLLRDLESFRGLVCWCSSAEVLRCVFCLCFVRLFGKIYRYWWSLAV